MTLSSSSTIGHQGIDPDALKGLNAVFGGEIMTPGQPGFDDSRAIWNSMIDAEPAVIVRPTGVSDVIRAVAFAREHELEISIKGGGHNVAGYALTEGGLTIDMEHLRQVQVDPTRRTALAGGGARWSDFDRETGVFGLATTGGVVSTTGVAGLTLGGGVGWLVGAHGLASDNVLSATLVTADGSVVIASDTSHPELFWALRGGGGNFGVVTALEFQLHPVPMVFAGMIAYPLDKARDLFEMYRELTMTAPDQLTSYYAIMTEPETGGRIVVLPFCWSGDVAEGQEYLQPVLDFGTPIMSMVAPMPYAAFNGGNDALFPYNRRNYWKGAMVTELEDGLFDHILEFAGEPSLPGNAVTIECYAGAMNRVDRDAAAFPHRDARYQIVANSQWDDPADDAQGRTWTRALHSAIEPYAKRGAFLNFVDVDGDDRQQRVRAGYGDHWDRLVQVKRTYDPDNVFHRNNTIAT